MSWDKELENDIENGLRATFRLIGSIFIALKLGVYQLRKKTNLIIFFVVTILSAIGNYLFLSKYPYIWLGAPLLVICIYGSIRLTQIEKSKKIFQSVNFKGKDGKYPYLISSTVFKGKTTSFYKSNIPLPIWQKDKDLLETALNCKIVHMEYGKSKKIVALRTLPTDYELPTKIPFEMKDMMQGESEIVIGESMAGQVHFDFNIVPHYLMAGETNSGKSTLMRLVVGQCLCKNHKVYLMDFKYGVEFGREYDDFCEVIMDKKRATQVLDEVVKENARRLMLFRSLGVKNLREYNKLKKDDPMERIVVFIDELSVLLIPTGEREDAVLSAISSEKLAKIATLGRAAGINLVLGIQRPDAKTVDGQIKSNVSGRVCGHFADSGPSMIALGNTDATKLPSDIKGRFLFQGGEDTIEIQVYYLNEKELVDNVITSRTIKYSNSEENSSTETMVKKTEKKIKKDKRDDFGLNTDFD